MAENENNEEYANPIMTHVEFLQLKRVGGIVVEVEPRTAEGILYNYLPNSYRYPFYFWSWAWLFSIPTFITVMFFYSWWVGLLLLIFITTTLENYTRHGAVSLVIKYLDHNPILFESLADKKLITLKVSQDYPVHYDALMKFYQHNVKTKRT